MSHPTRVRGLKQFLATLNEIKIVAPHTGAWIETVLNPRRAANSESHPTRVRGLKRSNLPNNQ